MPVPGASATIGVQNSARTKVLGLSHNSATLLSGGLRAFAVAPSADCIASPMRAADGSSCRISLPVAEIAEGEVCGYQQNATIPVPALPSFCPLPGEVFVRGVVTGPAGRVGALPGHLPLEPGEYTVAWSLATPADSFSGTGYRTFTGDFEQTLLIQESRDPGLCCPNTLTVDSLTTTDDVETYVSGPVCVLALQGDDVVTCAGTADVLLGHAGGDSVSGGGGADRVYGGTDSDRLYGDAGDDVIYGDAGNDLISGDAGNDILRGGPDDDEVYGGDDDDVLIPGSGVDFVEGEDGNDDIVILNVCELASGKTLDGGGGTDRLLLPAGVTLGSLSTAGVVVQNIESTATLPAGKYGVADCDPSLGPLAVPVD